MPSRIVSFSREFLDLGRCGWQNGRNVGASVAKGRNKATKLEFLALRYCRIVGLAGNPFFHGPWFQEENFVNKFDQCLAFGRRFSIAFLFERD